MRWPRRVPSTPTNTPWRRDRDMGTAGSLDGKEVTTGGDDRDGQHDERCSPVPVDGERESGNGEQSEHVAGR